MQWRRLGRAHRRKRNHHHRLRIAKRGRHIQAQVQRVLGGQRQRRNVLEMRRVQRGKNLRRVHNGAHVGAIQARSGQGRVAELVHQIPGRSIGQLRHQRLRVGIVQHQPVRVLHQARRLLIAGLVEALLVYPDAKRPRGFLRTFLQRGRIGLRRHLNVVEIRVQAHPIQARCLQILRRAHKGAGASAHRVAQGAEVASRLRSQKHDGLLRFRGNGHKHALVVRLVRPCLNARKPPRRRRIGGPAQKGDNQNKVRGLALRKIRMDP